MNKKKRLRHIQKNPHAYIPITNICRNCNEVGLHFVPPSFNEEGFFTCQSK